VGDRADCLYRDCLVVVTGWTDAPISWPRSLPVGERGYPSIVVTEELARAIRHESAAAIQHWWGVCNGVSTAGAGLWESGAWTTPAAGG
jgi:hypothetical protein